MKIFVILFLLIYFQNSQVNTVELYYKNYSLNEKSKVKKAKYKKVFLSNDSLKEIKVYKLLNGNEILIDEGLEQDNQPVGTWNHYNREGQKEFSLYYSNKKIKNGYYFNSSDLNNSIENTDFTLPNFQGNNENVFKYLANSIKYPQTAQDNGIQGKVYVHLKIDSTGKPTPLSIYRSAHIIIDKEAFRVLEEMPNWSPATKNNTTINSYIIFPINFKIH